MEVHIEASIGHREFIQNDNESQAVELEIYSSTRKIPIWRTWPTLKDKFECQTFSPAASHAKLCGTFPERDIHGKF